MTRKLTDAHMDLMASALAPTLNRVADKNPQPETPRVERDRVPRCELCNRPGRMVLLVLAHDDSIYPPNPARVQRALLCKPHRTELEISCRYPQTRNATFRGRRVYAVNPSD